MLTIIKSLLRATPWGSAMTWLSDVLLSRIGQLVIVAVLAFGLGWKERGSHDNVTDLKRKISDYQMTIAANDLAIDAASRRAETAQKDADSARQRIQSYVDDLAKRKKSDRCTISDADARSLLGF